MTIHYKYYEEKKDNFIDKRYSKKIEISTLKKLNKFSMTKKSTLSVGDSTMDIYNIYDYFFNRLSQQLLAQYSFNYKNKIKNELKKLGFVRFFKDSYYDTDSIKYIHYEANCIISFSSTILRIYFPFELSNSEKEFYLKLKKTLIKFRNTAKKDKPCVGLVINNGNNLVVRDIDILDVDVNIDDYYNDDFKYIHQLILDNLLKKESNSLIVFQSEPGCGKTFYIRHLVKIFPKEKFIFMPPELASSLNNPTFLKFALEELKDSILIIEDGESILRKREFTGTSAVSTLLNLTDGIMKDALNLKIICTANCKMDDMDEALSRKGRLLAKYSFEKLDKDKCNKIFSDQDIDFVTDKDMTLADVFNATDKSFAKVKQQIGFGR